MNKNRSLASVIALLGLVTGCSTVTPHYDARFGDAVRDSKRRMTVAPDAGKSGDPVAGMDGRAARESINRYESSFKDPPPAVTVINIGGAIGGR
jgi:hypothetical protein